MRIKPAGDKIARALAEGQDLDLKFHRLIGALALTWAQRHGSSIYSLEAYSEERPLATFVRGFKNFPESCQEGWVSDGAQAWSLWTTRLKHHPESGPLASVSWARSYLWETGETALLYVDFIQVPTESNWTPVWESCPSCRLCGSADSEGEWEEGEHALHCPTIARARALGWKGPGGTSIGTLQKKST
ncbi:MAG: hypothetical protein CMJ75_22880 [Planctomycetaceae bacterium]|nr:hypothetical protein [Planctomycetaceae bacterium]